MRTLQKHSGLSNIDPLWRHLGLADEIALRYGRWNVIHQKMPVMAMYDLAFLGEQGLVEGLQQGGEPILAAMIEKLIAAGLDPIDVFRVFIFILMNLRELKAFDGIRSIDDYSVDDDEFTLIS